MKKAAETQYKFKQVSVDFVVDKKMVKLLEKEIRYWRKRRIRELNIRLYS